MFKILSRQLPTRTIPHRTGIGPDDLVLFCGSGPSGELSWWGIVLGIVVLVSNGWALFLSSREMSLVECYPRTIKNIGLLK